MDFEDDDTIAEAEGISPCYRVPHKATLEDHVLAREALGEPSNEIDRMPPSNLIYCVILVFAIIPILTAHGLSITLSGSEKDPLGFTDLAHLLLVAFALAIVLSIPVGYLCSSGANIVIFSYL